MSGQPKSAKLRGKKYIQAVLLADSFMTPHRFRPMTHNTPKVLIPLVNVPMLEYTLEFLSTSNVDEIIIFASSHADQIQNYINGTRWLHKEPDLSVSIITHAESRSVGDALRYLDQLHVIKNDFILLTGDVVSNIDLNPMIIEHRKRSSENPEITMTMLFTTVLPGHAMRSPTDDLLVATDRLTGRIVHYSNDGQTGTVKINTKALLAATNGVNFHSNAYDTGIFICNRRLVNIFADQFDFQDIRNDYIAQQLNFGSESVISESGITFDHIQSQFASLGAYANRITDMRTYHTCSHDIIRKWLSPIIISNNILSKTSYTSYPNNVYRENKVSLAQTTLLKADCVVGSGSKFGFSTLLHKAIIARNVTVGNSCSLTTCYVLEGTVIGDGCVMNGAFIGKNVKIGNNVTLHKGSVVDDNVVIGDNVVVPPYVSITTATELDDEEKDALIQEKNRINAICKSSTYVNLAQIADPAVSANDITITKRSHAEISALDTYPVDARTFFYNNETADELRIRLDKLSRTHINTNGYDDDHVNIHDMVSAPRIMLPSIEILQLHSSPHQVFAKPTMPDIIQSFQSEQDLNAAESMMKYSQCDVAKHFSPYTNKGYEALLSNQHKKKPSSPAQECNVTMLSPSTLQQTLHKNDQQTHDALAKKLPYYPLADLTTLHQIDSELVVGKGGSGRLYLHPPHKKYGRAIALLNSTAPPAYLTTANYKPLMASMVIRETIEADEYDYDDYSNQSGSDYEDEDAFEQDFSTDNPLGEGEESDDDNSRTTRLTLKMSAQSTLLEAATTKTLDGARTFIGEVIGSMKRSLKGEKVANIIQELPTLRLVYRDVGFDVYLLAVILGIFSMANIAPPNQGLYKDQAHLAWEAPPPSELKAAQMRVARLFLVWSTTLKPASPGDALTLLLPALTTACLLNSEYASLFRVLLDRFYDADYLPEDDIIEYHERISQNNTLHTTSKSLLPSFVDYAGANIVGLDALVKSLGDIVADLEDEDEDEDEDE